MLTTACLVTAMALLACGGASTAQTPADPSVKPPGVGWHCAVSKDKPYSDCFREQAVCDALVAQNEAVRKKAGASDTTWGTCQPSPTAYCFTTQKAELGDARGVGNCPPVNGWEAPAVTACRFTRQECETQMRDKHQKTRRSPDGKAGLNEKCLMMKVSTCTAWE
jgi:hypothetical protein